MADTSQNSRSTYVEGLKWVLALSIAAIAGAFLHLSDLSKLPFSLKLVAAGAIMAFLVATFFGVQYLIRLFTDDVRRHELKEINEKTSATEAEKDRAKKLAEKLDKSNASRPWLYKLHTVFTVVAAVLVFGFLPAAILTFKDDSKKPDCPCACTTCRQETNQIQPTPERFAIVYSAVHPGRGGKVQHTFLLDKQTGTLWQMTWQKNGTVVLEETPRKKLHEARPSGPKPVG
ncbi:MAG TPA: hypothetical protein VG759_25245 [Candidatus Angelobacter sp.]|jgi:hypothetical protein|nr:hypothetical protein [Candidatus Angelobacter sp.]